LLRALPEKGVWNCALADCCDVVMTTELTEKITVECDDATKL